MAEKNSTTYGYLDRIATALEESIGTVDPDNDKHTATTFKYLNRIATAVENGAGGGGGGGGYSKKTEEMVIFDGDAAFVRVQGETELYYILRESAESLSDDVALDKFYDDATIFPAKLTFTGLPEVLFGNSAIDFNYDGQYVESSVLSVYYSYGKGEEYQELCIQSNLELGRSELHIRRDVSDYSLENAYDVNLNLYGTTEVMEVTKDFTDAVEVVTGYKIDTAEKVLLDTYQVEVVPNNQG